MSSLTSRVIAGSKWMIILRLVNRAGSTIVSIILARTLAPEAFGLVAIGVLTISFLQVLSEVGVKQALIVERRSDDENLLDCAWTIEMIRGLLVFGLVLLLANLVASFYEKPEAVNVIMCLASVPLIRSATSIRVIYLQKELDFKKQFWYEISGLVGSVFVSIPLAFILQNVWAIVIGTVTSELVKTCLSYYVSPYKPKMILKKVLFLRLFKFGKWIMAGSIISYFAMELDTYVAAKVFDSRLLGIYVLAFSLTNKPIIEIGKALGKVLFPAFTKLGDDIQRIKNAFLKSSFALYLFLVPAGLGLSLVSEDLVLNVLGKKWSEMIPIVTILSIGVVFRGLVIPATGLFNGIGKPNVVFILSVVRTIVLAVSIVLLINDLTVTRLADTVLFSNIAVFIAFIISINKYIKISLKQFMIYLLPIIFSSTIMILSIETLKYFFETGFLRMVMSLVFGFVSYISVYYIYSKLNSQTSQIVRLGSILSYLKNAK